MNLGLRPISNFEHSSEVLVISPQQAAEILVDLSKGRPQWFLFQLHSAPEMLKKTGNYLCLQVKSSISVAYQESW